MPFALLASLALAAASATPPPAAPAPAAAEAVAGGENLWLVEPLYPGQEILVGRTESAIHQLLPQGSRDRVGRAALQELLTGRKGDLGCALGEKACPNPVDAYLRSLGLAKVVLIKGGQEEPNYRYEVSSVDLTTGETRNASGSGPVLEKALLAALVKVAPLASALHVASNPPGLDLFVDGEKFGKTPYDGQILPGERTIKLSGAGYQDLVKTVNVPARGTVSLDEKLDLLPSTLIIKPIQKQAAIYVDGKAVGVGDVTVPVVPGPHTVEARLEQYETYQHAVTVSPNGQTTDIPDLHPTPEMGIRKNTLYLQLGFEMNWLRKHNGTYRVNAVPLNKVTGEDNPAVGALGASGSIGYSGISADFGQQKDHFGLLLLGFSYLKSGAGKMPVYTASNPGHFNDPNVLTVTGDPTDWMELRFAQPQVNIVVWHIMGYAQAGLGVRALRIDTPDFTDVKDVRHGDGYLDVAPYLGLTLGLRGYLWEGVYLHGSYRFTYVVSLNARGSTFTTLSPFDGLNVGLGYAF